MVISLNFIILNILDLYGIILYGLILNVVLIILRKLVSYESNFINIWKLIFNLFF